MSLRLPSVAAVVLLLGASAAAAKAQVTVMPAHDYRSMYDALTSLRPDLQRVAPIVTTVTLQRPGFDLVLGQGQVSLLAVGDRVIGATFVGTGSATVTPALDLEQRELAREFGSESVHAVIESAVMLFADGTLDELESVLTFAPGAVEGNPGRVVDRATKFLKGPEDDTYDPRVMSTFLNRLETALFHIHMDASDGPDLFYRYDNGADEEVMFGQDGPRDTYEVLTRFHPEEHYVDGAWLDETPGQLVDFDAYDLDIRVDDDAITMKFHGSIHLTPRQDGELWVPMQLFKDLDIERLAWSGEPATFFRPKDSAALWVKLPADARAGQPLDLEVSYAGDFGRRQQGWYGLLSSTGWYPSWSRNLSMFDLTFFVPSNLDVVAAGQRVLNEVRGDTIVTRWVTAEPAVHASFNVGPFEVEHFNDVAGVPPLTIQVQKEGHNLLAERGGSLASDGAPYKIGLDVANSIAFFQSVYGPVDRSEFMVAEIPYAHGQAFPGMIHLSFATYFLTRESGADESFRAHEVAHQWWGLGVQAKTPRDRWLEEGFSEFSSLWYMIKVKFDPDRVYEILEEKKRAILSLRDKAGPVWLGTYHLNKTRVGGEHYSRIVYDKGAWILHMLRVLLMDPQTQNDGVFTEIMTSLYGRYEGGDLSTADFQAHLEAETGLDLEWFFQQWVYGTDIPTYRFSYTIQETADGQYQMAGRVVQEDVPDDFVSYVPVLVDFGEEGFFRVRAKIEGPETIIQFPLLPLEPKDVVFNDLLGVLADVKTEGWKGLKPWGD